MASRLKPPGRKASVAGTTATRLASVGGDADTNGPSQVGETSPVVDPSPPATVVDDGFFNDDPFDNSPGAAESNGLGLPDESAPSTFFDDDDVDPFGSGFDAPPASSPAALAATAIGFFDDSPLPSLAEIAAQEERTEAKEKAARAKAEAEAEERARAEGEAEIAAKDQAEAKALAAAEAEAAAKVAREQREAEEAAECMRLEAEMKAKAKSDAAAAEAAAIKADQEKRAARAAALKAEREAAEAAAAEADQKARAERAATLKAEAEVAAAAERAEREAAEAAESEAAAATERSEREAAEAAEQAKADAEAKALADANAEREAAEAAATAERETAESAIAVAAAAEAAAIKADEDLRAARAAAAKAKATAEAAAAALTGGATAPVATAAAAAVASPLSDASTTVPTAAAAGGNGEDLLDRERFEQNARRRDRFLSNMEGFLDVLNTKTSEQAAQVEALAAEQHSTLARAVDAAAGDERWRDEAARAEEARRAEARAHSERATAYEAEQQELAYARLEAQTKASEKAKASGRAKAAAPAAAAGALAPAAAPASATDAFEAAAARHAAHEVAEADARELAALADRQKLAWMKRTGGSGAEPAVERVEVLRTVGAPVGAATTLAAEQTQPAQQQALSAEDGERKSGLWGDGTLPEAAKVGGEEFDLDAAHARLMAARQRLATQGYSRDDIATAKAREAHAKLMERETALRAHLGDDAADVASADDGDDDPFASMPDIMVATGKGETRVVPRSDDANPFDDAPPPPPRRGGDENPFANDDVDPFSGTPVGGGNGASNGGSGGARGVPFGGRGTRVAVNIMEDEGGDDDNPFGGPPSAGGGGSALRGGALPRGAGAAVGAALLDGPDDPFSGPQAGAAGVAYGGGGSVPAEWRVQAKDLDQWRASKDFRGAVTCAFGGVFSCAMYGTAEARDFETGATYTEYIMRCQWGTTFNHMAPWMVARRFREFCALDANLKEAYPDAVDRFPKMPGKTFFGTLSPDTVETRQRELEAYIVGLFEMVPAALHSAQVSARVLPPPGPPPSSLLPNGFLCPAW